MSIGNVLATCYAFSTKQLLNKVQNLPLKLHDARVIVQPPSAHAKNVQGSITRLAARAIAIMMRHGAS